jgi:hypothetical protein
MLNEFSKNNPDENGVPQLSQKAVTEGMSFPYDTQCNISRKPCGIKIEAVGYIQLQQLPQAP